MTHAPAAVAVFGANGGIGRAVVEHFARQSVTVFACARHSIPAVFSLESPVQVDPADEYSIANACLTIAHETDRLDAIIYCSGDIRMEKIRDLPLDAWQRMLAANLTGPFLVAKHGIPLLRAGGSLIIIGAQSDRLILPGFAAYAAGKSALETLAAALAKEERSIKVAVLRPSAVDTRFWAKVPLRLPRNAMSAAAVAQRIDDILVNGESGMINL